MLVPHHLVAIGIALVWQVSLASAITVGSTILIFARDAYSGNVASSGLKGYGIPYEVVIVPQAGIVLPVLNSTATSGNYGGIIIVSEVAYSYPTGWASAITAAQLTTIYGYQTSFGVRMVRLDVFPAAEFGVTTAVAGAGCCDAGVEQLMSFTSTTAFASANIKTGAGVTTQGLWHYPATITNATIATQIAQFAPAGVFTTNTVAAVINTFGARKQMVFFIGWATDWSASSNFLQHAFIHWMTRGLFVGKRKLYLSTQVDDMQLETGLYEPADAIFRVRTGDLNAHKTWQTQLNTRLPAGSKYFLEMGHNGNGDIIAALDTNNNGCNPDGAVDYDSPPDTPLEFQKPLSSGTDLWPSTFVTYPWSLACAKKDPLANWFTTAANRNAFAHVSHTFTHEELNNATYNDAKREIQFNQAWLAQIGISSATMFSANGLIPPAITGLHNGDVIKAWLDNTIQNVVGDNTRPVLRNPNNDFWPLITTVPGNGYAGLTIIPRWATTIYYNCDLPDCTLHEWINTSGGSGDFNALLDNARSTNTRYLLGLHPDPYMFHQANMRQTDVATRTVGTQTGKFSIFQLWVETIAQEMTRLTNWPILSLKHDDIAKLFKDRMALDGCTPKLSYTYAANGLSITGVTVTTTGNSCPVKVPVTFPGTASTSTGGTTNDKIGSEPLIIWTPMTGSAVTFTLGTPVPV